MRIEKISRNHEGIDLFIKEKENENEEWGFYEGMFDWDFIKENVLKNSEVLAVFKNGKIETICLIRRIPKLKELDFLPNDFLYSDIIDSLNGINEKEQIKNLFNFIKSEYPNIILNWNKHYDGLMNAGFELIKFPYESENRNGYYKFFDFEPYVIENKEKILNSFYQKLQRGVIKNIMLEFLTIDEFRERIYEENYSSSIPIFEDCGHSLFDGFSYFGPQDLNTYNSPKDTRFVFATTLEFINEKETKRIVGVIKIAKYENSYSEYTGINFIDVHHYYRKLGISKLMYKKLNECLSEKDILIGSMLSEMGKKAKINEVRKNIITKCPVFDSNEEFYQSKFQVKYS